MRVAVLGQGMLGGSLQAALVAAGWAASGWDPEPGVRKRMRQRGLESEATPDRALRGAGISVLCAPPRGILELLGSPALKGFPGVVTDVGSVKREIARAGRRALGSRFVPGHPMAGAAESGVGAQRPDLFRDRIWVLAGGSADARTVVRRMVRRVGAHPVEMTPARHDQLVAWTSHLPQILAWMVAARAERHGNLPEGPAYAALSRLAGARGREGGIERQRVCLLGDGHDHFHHLADLRRRG